MPLLEVLGAAATAPTVQGAASSYLVDVGAASYLLVDAGPGAALELLRGRGLDGLAGIVLTHLHADHALDLMALAYRWTFPDQRPRIPVWVPEGEQTKLAAFDDLFGIPTLPAMRRPIAQAFEVRELALDGRSPVQVGEAELTAFAARHAVPAAALRCQVGNRVVAFSADTGPCDEVADAARRADVFVCEATYLEATPAELIGHGHLTGTLAGELAAQAEVRSLLLTHFARPEDGPEARRQASAVYGGPVGVAVPGVTSG